MHIFRLFFVSLMLTVLTGVPAKARSIALLIANSNYTEMGTLRNPANDISRIGTSLQRLGFEVRRATDLRRNDLTNALLSFSAEARGADTAMIFYSGHGFEVDGVNYLIPVDFAPRHPSEVKLAAIRLQDAMDAVAGATRLSVVVLDACRDNPMASSTRGGSRGLARVTANPSQVVAYSTAPGALAQDGYGTTSPYTQALAEMMETNPNIDVRQLFTSLSSRTTELAQTIQTPYAEFGAFSAQHVSLTGATRSSGTATTPPAPRVEPSAEMIAYWNAIKDSRDRNALQQFIDNYPESRLSDEAKRRISLLETPEPAPEQPQTPRYIVRPDQKHASSPPPTKKGLLPHASQIPPSRVLPIDGVWTADFNGAQFRFDQGRMYALTPYMHLLVFPVELEDVVVQGLRRDAPGRYAGYDLVAQATWTGSLNAEGNIDVKVGSPVPFTTVMRPATLDHSQAFQQERDSVSPPSSYSPPQPPSSQQALVTPSPALKPYDGQYTYEMSCEAVRGQAAQAFRNAGGGFVEQLPVTVSNGAFRLANGTPGTVDSYDIDGTVSDRGDVTIRGSFVNFDNARKRIRFDPGRSLTASGRRGRRYCEVKLIKN